MPTSKRDALFLRRMFALICTGVALTLTGALLYPIRALAHPEKENPHVR